MVPLKNRIGMSGYISPQIFLLLAKGVHFGRSKNPTSRHGLWKGPKNIFDIHLLTTPSPNPTPNPVSVISHFRNSMNLDLGPHMTLKSRFPILRLSYPKPGICVARAFIVIVEVDLVYRFNSERILEVMAISNSWPKFFLQRCKNDSDLLSRQ
jgi:hypothetical protein